MEQQNVQVEEGIQLMDIFKLFLRKMKVLILALVIGAIAGGAFAVWRTYDVNYFGTQVEFYVNPEKNNEDASDNESQYGVYGAYGRHVMDNMIKLLGSESFTEKMILNGKLIPEKDVWVNADNPDEVALNLNDAIDAAQAKIDVLETKKAALEVAQDKKDEQVKLLNEANSVLNDEWKEAKAGLIFDEATYLKEYKDQEATYPNLIAAYNARESVQLKVNTANDEVTAAQKAKNKAQSEADVEINETLELWRQTAAYKADLSKYKAAVAFSYLKDEEDYTDANNLARSFIYVNISVLNDEKFANELLEIVKTVVPAYVESNMTVPTGYDGTNCQRITRTDDIHSTNPGYATKQAIKYGLLAGLAALVIAAVVVVVLDKSDKRLRDPEDITKMFNIPLLGVVPSIDELAEQTKKNEEVK